MHGGENHRKSGRPYSFFTTCGQRLRISQQIVGSKRSSMSTAPGRSDARNQQLLTKRYEHALDVAALLCGCCHACPRSSALNACAPVTACQPCCSNMVETACWPQKNSMISFLRAWRYRPSPPPVPSFFRGALAAIAPHVLGRATATNSATDYVTRREKRKVCTPACVCPARGRARGTTRGRPRRRRRFRSRSANRAKSTRISLNSCRIS
eukprot:COSAG02_NODE_3000_length_7578_cov_218.918305_5_plen_210_part_00